MKTALKEPLDFLQVLAISFIVMLLVFFIEFIMDTSKIVPALTFGVFILFNLFYLMRSIWLEFNPKSLLSKKNQNNRN